MISVDFSIVYQIVIFFVLWAILSKVLFRPYIGLLEKRERATSGASHDSEALEREGARLKAQYEERLAQAQAAAAAVKEGILQEARQQRERIIGEAREQAAAFLEKTRQEIQAQVDQERRRAIAEIGELARDMAAKILGRSVP
jgi:F-type H+-transporting ATPase subunit b